MDGWDDTENWEIPNNHLPKTKISIVIAARNEEKHIASCLQSILQNSYPKDLYEVIVVDDHSTDDTSEIVQKFTDAHISLLSLNEGKGKKKALEEGIRHASGTLIACTDADCEVPQGWLKSFISYYEMKHVKCIAGPIRYKTNKSVLQRFQFLDALNNMCVTANGILKKQYYMANGANLFFTKEVFDEVGGYRNNAQLASGDDMFLIQEIASRYPNQVHFLKSKEAVVSTQPETSLHALKLQRTRWATKSKAYTNKNIMKIQAFVFGFVVLIIINLAFSPFGSSLSLFGFLIALFIKWTMDYLYLSKLADFFGNRKPLKSFFSASLGFIAYILFAGWKALRPSNYVWKGRKTY
ncbi:MAG: glycosyltransferase [Bacteroidota bacterium]